MLSVSGWGSFKVSGISPPHHQKRTGWVNQRPALRSLSLTLHLSSEFCCPSNIHFSSFSNCGVIQRNLQFILKFILGTACFKWIFNIYLNQTLPVFSTSKLIKLSSLHCTFRVNNAGPKNSTFQISRHKLKQMNHLELVSPFYSIPLKREIKCEFNVDTVFGVFVLIK